MTPVICPVKQIIYSPKIKNKNKMQPLSFKLFIAWETENKTVAYYSNDGVWLLMLLCNWWKIST